jgi:hypothetical protein
VKKSGKFTIVPLEPQIHWHIIEREVICGEGHVYDGSKCAIAFSPPEIYIPPNYDDRIFEQETLIIDFDVFDDGHMEGVIVDTLDAPQGVILHDVGDDRYILEWTPLFGMAQPGPYRITLGASNNGGITYDAQRDLYVYVLEQ